MITSSPGLAGGKNRIVTRMLCAVADDDLGRFVVNAVVQQELVGNRLTKFRNAGTGCVFGKSRFQSRDGSSLNVFGSVEVRLACSEAANIDPFGFHRLGLAVDRKGKRRS